MGEPSKEIRGIAVSPDGRGVAAAAVDGLKLYEASTGVAKLSVKDERFFSVAFSRKGDLMGAGAGNWSLRIWDIASLSASKPAAK